jgi:carbamoyl-phosphate synthase large subunit
MEKLKIGISGINATDNPGPGIGVARSLKESKDLDVEIVGLAYDAMDPGIYMDFVVDKSFILPYPSNDFNAYIERLAYIKNSYGLDFIFPNLDAELSLYIRFQDEFEKLGIKTFLPSLEQFKLRGKDHLEKVAERIGLALPKTKVINSLEQLHQSIQELGLPVMVKGPFYKAYIAHTISDAIHHFHHLVSVWGYPIIVQSVVSGEEMNVVAVGDGEGNPLGMVGLKKMLITELGKIWTGVSIKNEKMLEATQAFIKEFKWRGPFELECIVNLKKNVTYLIEINPRFPAWSYFATGLGVNLPAQIIKKVYGMDYQPIDDFPVGKLFIRYSYEIISDMDKFKYLVTYGES